MLDKIFDINKFNIFSDGENYYFFRALNMADNNDIENGITLDSKRKISFVEIKRRGVFSSDANVENSCIEITGIKVPEGNSTPL